MQQQQDWQAAQRRQSEDALVAEWRGDFEANSSTARHFTVKIAEQAGVSPENAVRLAGDPDFARMALAMAKLTREDGLKTPAGTGYLRTPRQRADEIMRGTDEQWGRLYQEGNRQALEVVSGLLKEAAR
jgi:hypothetical protein